MNFKFSKWHGLGNDFIIINGFQENIIDYSKLAINICDRHFGIGADGVVVILPSETADFKMRIINSDGSEAEMCGNAVRCVARYTYEAGMTGKRKIVLETLAGSIKPELQFKDGIIHQIRVDMGEPRLQRQDIPVQGSPEEKLIAQPLAIEEQIFNITCVSMGNPHCIIFVDDVGNIDLEKIGRKIEYHSLFPRKTNVEFVQVVNPELVKMRVWERGAGVTLACGTGACATLVACVLNEKTNRRALIELDGGALEVEWGEDNHIYMSGSATEVFRGEYIGK